MSANDKATPSADVPRKPRRRWLQVSLRTLLILVTLLSIGLGWFVHRGERQRRAVAAILEMGGSITYDSPAAAAEFFDFDRWLPLDCFDDVCIVDLYASKVTDAGMMHVKVLPRLEGLKLAETHVTDAGLTHIQKLTELKWLTLDGTDVTDAGLAQLEGLTQLKYLSLNATQVTDVGLQQLQGLISLEELNLFGTQVTAAGIAKLQRTLPKCTIRQWSTADLGQ